MIEELRHTEARALQALAEAPDLEALQVWHRATLGRRGALTVALRGLGQLPPEERPEAGRIANLVKEGLEAAYEARRAEVEARQAAAAESAIARDGLDVRLPGRPQGPGALHIITQTLREVYGIFGQMGFTILRSPEVEDDLTNFQLLNFPPYHPARDMQDSFHTTRPGVLLRTHTSPGQIHAMRQFCPNDIRVILPGKCYRYEQVTSRSEFMFYQVEGLAISRAMTMSDLKGVLAGFARQMFGAERRLRFRASYFPFTEPSAEVDMDCILCGGSGCTLCKHTGWLEILGCGMVHPNVLRNGGYDPDEFSGYAFGMGPERMAMLKHGINDIRYFYSNDLRFLSQFG